MTDEGARLFDEALQARLRLQRSALLAVAAAFALALFAQFASVLRRPDLVLLDIWQSLRGTDKPTGQVVIVGIDEKSIQKFGPPAWPRKEYVPLIERLSKAGAKVIGFDITFGTLEREAENNELLAQAMTAAGNVVFGFELTGLGNPSPPGVPASQAIRSNALSRAEGLSVPPAHGLLEPEPVLAQAAAALGHVSTVASDDGRIRVLPLVIRHGAEAYPSLGLQVARVYTKTPMSDVSLGGEVLTLGSFRIPVSDSGEVLLNWPAAPDKAFPQYSFLDVVRGDVPDEAFRGKAVLVAGTAAGLDDRALPFAPKAPGVFLHATLLDNIFRSDFVQSPGWAFLVEWALLFGACVVAGFVLPRLRTAQLIGGVPAGVLLLVLSAAFLYVQRGVYLKIFYPGLVLLLPSLVLLAHRLRESERETRDLTAEKVEKEKLLGLSFQEKGMLDMALATFNKLPLTSDMKHVYVNLGIDYEHRGHPDKAYLVYKKVFDLDPSFEGVATLLERLQAGREARTAVSAPPTAEGGEILTRALPERRKDDTSPEVAEASGGILSAPTRQMPATLIGGASVAPSGPVQPGARFGRYQVERHLGRGGMGDVYLVRDTILNRKAALKTVRLDQDFAASELIELRQRFYREAQTAGRLTHPNIVTVYDVGEDLGMSYIVMEYVEGHTLSGLMKKDRLAIAQTKHVVAHAGLGLDFAHQNGVFHRDVKPDNIMVSKAGLVKVMDFGIARVVESELTKTGNVMGTPAYMSPEQVNGEKIDARSDIFSLGVILYELLTGEKPFTGQTMPSLMFAIIQSHPAQPSTMDAKIHGSWDEILGKALAKDRGNRYPTAMDFVRAVQSAGD